MEFHQYLQVVRQYWRSILAVLVLTVAAAAALTFAQTPVYSSSSAIFLTVDSGGSAGELSQGAVYAERTVASYVSVATTAIVLEPVIEELGLDLAPSDLAKELTVSSPPDTSILTIEARSEDPRQAALISNSVAASLLDAVDDLAPSGPAGTRLVSATVIDRAQPPEQPASPRPASNLVLGAILGAFLGVGQALLRSSLDTRVRSEDDVHKVTDVPILASVGRNTATRSKATGAATERWASAEAYRRLRTSVGFLGLGGERRPSMVITSSLAGEGKTETAVNLARVLAQAGESVLLIDADLRRPQVAQRMRLDAEFGLVDVLTGKGDLDDFKIEVSTGHLSVLPAGAVPPNPSELLGSAAMTQLITTAERGFDYVLFDTPPLLPVADALVLASRTGGAIVVTRSGQARRSELGSALSALASSDVPALGIVLNDAPATATTAVSGYYTSDFAED